MSHFLHDTDLWEFVPGDCRPCTGCRPNPNGGMNICTGMCNGMASSGHYRPRAPEEVVRIKAERERKREDAVLAEAELIRARRESF